MTIITIANQKGGVGKTATAVTLAHGAALRGLRVLLVDLDTQGNAADSLGLDAAGDLFRWLIQGQPLQVCAIQARPGLDLIRSDKTTVALKTILAGQDFRERCLVAGLAGNRYDLVVFDCSPSADILHTAALVAADYLIIPAQMSQYAIKGVVEVRQSLDAITRVGGSKCSLAGIIPTFFDRVTNESQLQLENLAGAFKSLVWPVVPIDNKVREANRAGQTLWEYAQDSRAVTGYELNGKRVGGYAQVLDRLMGIV